MVFFGKLFIPLKEFKIQLLVFDRKTFKNRKQVKDWIIKNNYKIMKWKKQPIEKTEKTFICKQRECCRFKKRTLKPRYLKKGVKGIYGKLK